MAAAPITMPAAAAAGVDDEAKSCGVYVDLDACINKKCALALNADRRFGVGNLWQSDERFQLKSDLDPQLLLMIPFSSVVKVHSIDLQAPTDDAALLPTSLKIFVNKSSLGFDEIEDFDPTMEFELSPKDFERGSVLKLKFHKFQRVTSLHLFFDHEDDDDSDEEFEKSVLSCIKFYGKNTQGTDVSQIKKVG